MYKVFVEDINDIVRPKMLFTHTNELETPYLADAETEPTKNNQGNGAVPPLVTQTSLLH